MLRLYMYLAVAAVLSVPANASLILDENFDDGLADGFTFVTIANINLWHITGNLPLSAPYALGYSLEATGNYNTGSQNAANALTPLFVVPVAQYTSIVFDMLTSVEFSANFDTIFLDIGSGSSFTQIASKAAFLNDGTYHTYTFNLSAFAGQTVQARFRFDSIDGDVNSSPGLRIDNLLISTVEGPEPNFGLAVVGFSALLAARASWNRKRRRAEIHR